VKGLAGTGNFIACYMSPVELAIDRIVVQVFQAIKEHSVRRVVIDALGDIANAAEDNHRFHDYLYALTQHLITRDVTAMLTFETMTTPDTFSGTVDARFSSMSDCLIELALDVRGKPRRTLRVAKARGIGHDLRAHELIIEHGGIRLGKPVELP
jgi:circadian clock protein KaiC